MPRKKLRLHIIKRSVLLILICFSFVSSSDVVLDHELTFHLFFYQVTRLHEYQGVDPHFDQIARQYRDIVKVKNSNALICTFIWFL